MSDGMMLALVDVDRWVLIAIHSTALHSTSLPDSASASQYRDYQYVVDRY